MARRNLGRLFSSSLFSSSTPKLAFPYIGSEPETRSLCYSLSRLMSSSSNSEQPQSQVTLKEEEEEEDAIKQNPAIENEENQEEDEDDGVNKETGEIGGPRGPEPTRYGDWERGGRCSDF